jgi:cytoskeletal protein RodZ
MKKLISKFKQLDITKKVVIIFIAGSLLFTVGIASINALNVSSNNVAAGQFPNIKIKEETTNQSTNKDAIDNSTSNDSNNSSEKENNNSTTKSSNSNSNSQTSSSETTTNPKETITIRVKITGVNNTIASGSVSVEKDASAYSTLKEFCTSKGISVSSSGSNSFVYVKGINGLMEKQHGPLSGWMYKVNGSSPNVSAGSYSLSNNDQLEWYYTNYE